MFVVLRRMVLIASILAACAPARSEAAAVAAPTGEVPQRSPVGIGERETVVEVAGSEATPAAHPPAGPRPGTRAPRGLEILAAGTDAILAARVAAFGGQSAVVIADAVSGEVAYARNGERSVFAASLYKLGVLLEAERRIEGGKLRYADTVTVSVADQADGGSFTAAGTKLSIDEALRRMIVLSDNAAARALVRLLGVAAIHATLDREGLAELRFTSVGARTTARAVATFFADLARGELVSRAASARILARLGRQRVTDRLPALLPAGAVVAHKVGSLGSATHDAGIIRGASGRTAVVVVLTWDSTEEEATELIREVAEIVHGSLVPYPARAASVPRWRGVVRS